MNRVFLDRKGAGENLVSFWTLFMFILVGGCVLIAASIYYSAEVDVKQVEARILNEKLSECLVEQGVLNANFFSKEFDIYSECNLDKETFESQSSFFAGITLLDSEEKILVTENLINPMKIGDTAFERDCEVAQLAKSKEFPSCFSRELPVNYYEGNQLKQGVIRIIATSKNEGVFG